MLGVYKRYFAAYRKDAIRAMRTNSVENTESIYEHIRCRRCVEVLKYLV